MAFDDGLVEALVVDTRFAHGAFVVVGRALVGADGLHTAEAEELLVPPTPGGRRSLSRWAACLERVASVSLGPSLGCLRVKEFVQLWVIAAILLRNPFLNTILG